MRALAPIALFLMIGASQAGVSCTIDGRAIPVSESIVNFHYSASGTRGPSGKVSHFRLMTLDGGDGPESDVELKTVDVTTPGDYELSTGSGWRSVFTVAHKRQKVTGGRFHFKAFEVHRERGHAAGTVEFHADKIRGECRFDVVFEATETDRLTR